jgi:hypothetical protein
MGEPRNTRVGMGELAEALKSGTPTHDGSNHWSHQGDSREDGRTHTPTRGVLDRKCIDGLQSRSRLSAQPTRHIHTTSKGSVKSTLPLLVILAATRGCQLMLKGMPVQLADHDPSW